MSAISADHPNLAVGDIVSQSRFAVTIGGLMHADVGFPPEADTYVRQASDTATTNGIADITVLPIATRRSWTRLDSAAR